MIYFSSKTIEALQGYSPTERVAIIHRANQMMPFERKAFGNTLKVIILVALFWSVLYIPGTGWKLLAILLLGLLYRLAVLPVNLTLAVPYIPEAIRKHEQAKASGRDEPGQQDGGDSNHS
ncbi:DUF6170 family protein [Aliidiomarina sanyensis]|uniref:Uncharacterized protein n=1 Tax=Aliidiomarina sanyensis TaxID=1249555 RepID=A0A432WGE3_9GAMM|nr:DUF6170 family protein [Aliidiomarina sanyensis]RUO32823.1 hypothetical protein CWE11_07255 [Aliidiomarina sanyensis]